MICFLSTIHSLWTWMTLWSIATRNILDNATYKDYNTDPLKVLSSLWGSVHDPVTYFSLFMTTCGAKKASPFLSIKLRLSASLYSMTRCLLCIKSSFFMPFENESIFFDIFNGVKMWLGSKLQTLGSEQHKETDTGQLLNAVLATVH